MKLTHLKRFALLAIALAVAAPMAAQAADLTVTAASVVPAAGASLETGTAGEAVTAGQPVVVQKGGAITIGATLTAGTVYFLSGTAGGLRPAADNTTGDYPQVVGMATSTTLLQLNFGLHATAPL